MNDLLAAFIALVTGLIGIVGTGAIGYLLNRVRKLERDADTREAKDLRERDTKINALNEDISKMTFRVGELEKQAARVPALEQQVDTLCKELVDLRARLQAAEEAAKIAHDENGQLRATNERLAKDLAAAQLRIHDLETEHGVYDRILDRIGAERKPKSEGSPEPSESHEMKPNEEKPDVK